MAKEMATALRSAPDWAGADWFRFEQGRGQSPGRMRKEAGLPLLSAKPSADAALAYLLNAENAKNLAKIAEKHLTVFANYLALFAVYFLR